MGRTVTSRRRRSLPAPATLLLLAGALALLVSACGVQAVAHGSTPRAAAVYRPAPPKPGAWSFVSRPDLHPAKLKVSTDTGAAAPGYVFVTPGVAQYGQTAPLIVDAGGNPVWVGTVPAGANATDFRVQTYQGRPVLTWWQGRIVKPGYGRGVDVIANSSYRVIATVHAGNGLTADAHDFTITLQGTALITAYRRVPYDLSSLGGSKRGMLLDSLVQVVDIASGRVLFQWDPLTHVPLTDSYVKPVKGQLYDPYHVNSVAPDGSGDLLVSLRHTWTLYKVDLKTGGIVWRMGGKHSDFTVGPGASFAWQHAAFPQPAGRLLVFDNEAAGTQAHAATSHGLVLQVGEATRTVSLIHRFVHPGVLASSQGDVQALPGGDYLVGWGAAPVRQRVLLRRCARLGGEIPQDRPELPRVQVSVDGTSGPAAGHCRPSGGRRRNCVDELEWCDSGGRVAGPRRPDEDFAARRRNGGAHRVRDDGDRAARSLLRGAPPGGRRARSRRVGSGAGDSATRAGRLTVPVSLTAIGG